MRSRLNVSGPDDTPVLIVEVWKDSDPPRENPVVDVKNSSD